MLSIPFQWVYHALGRFFALLPSAGIQIVLSFLPFPTLSQQTHPLWTGDLSLPGGLSELEGEDSLCHPPQAEWAWSGEGQRGQSSGGELASPSHAGKSLSCPALSAMAPGWAHCVPSHCWHCHRMGNSTGRATHPLLIVDPPLVVLPHHHLDAAFPVVSLQHDSLGGRTGGHG